MLLNAGSGREHLGTIPVMDELGGTFPGENLLNICEGQDDGVDCLDAQG